MTDKERLKENTRLTIVFNKIKGTFDLAIIIKHNTRGWTYLRSAQSCISLKEALNFRNMKLDGGIDFSYKFVHNFPFPKYEYCKHLIDLYSKAKYPYDYEYCCTVDSAYKGVYLVILLKRPFLILATDNITTPGYEGWPEYRDNTEGIWYIHTWLEEVFISKIEANNQAKNYGIQNPLFPYKLNWPFVREAYENVLYEDATDTEEAKYNICTFPVQPVILEKYYQEQQAAKDHAKQQTKLAKQLEKQQVKLEKKQEKFNKEYVKHAEQSKTLNETERILQLEQELLDLKQKMSQIKDS